MSVHGFLLLVNSSTVTDVGGHIASTASAPAATNTPIPMIISNSSGSPLFEEEASSSSKASSSHSQASPSRPSSHTSESPTCSEHGAGSPNILSSPRLQQIEIVRNLLHQTLRPPQHDFEILSPAIPGYKPGPQPAPQPWYSPQSEQEQLQELESESLSAPYAGTSQQNQFLGLPQRDLSGKATVYGGASRPPPPGFEMVPLNRPHSWQSIYPRPQRPPFEFSPQRQRSRFPDISTNYNWENGDGDRIRIRPSLYSDNFNRGSNFPYFTPTVAYSRETRDPITRMPPPSINCSCGCGRYVKEYVQRMETLEREIEMLQIDTPSEPDIPLIVIQPSAEEVASWYREKKRSNSAGINIFVTAPKEDHFIPDSRVRMTKEEMEEFKKMQDMKFGEDVEEGRFHPAYQNLADKAHRTWRSLIFYAGAIQEGDLPHRYFHRDAFTPHNVFFVYLKQVVHYLTLIRTHTNWSMEHVSFPLVPAQSHAQHLALIHLKSLIPVYQALHSNSGFTGPQWKDLTKKILEDEEKGEGVGAFLKSLVESEMNGVRLRREERDKEKFEMGRRFLGWVERLEVAFDGEVDEELD